MAAYITQRYQVDLMRKTNKREVVYPRQLLCYACNKVLNISDSTIELYLPIDRTTIIYSSKKIEDLMIHKETREDVEQINEYINNQLLSNAE